MMYNSELVQACKYLESKGLRVKIEYSKVIYRPWYRKHKLYKSLYIPFKVNSYPLKFASIRKFSIY